MAVNENVNKVVCDGNVLIDLTEDTVEASTLVSGYTAHDASGSPIVGTLELSHTEEYEGTAVALPAGATFDKLEIFGSTVNGEPIRGYNLLDEGGNTTGYYINASGVVTSDTSYSVYTELIPVTPGGTYTISGHSGRANNKRLHAYKQDGTWARQVMYFTSGTTPVGSDYSDTFTLGSDVYFLRFSYAGEDTDVQLTNTSAVLPYMEHGAIGVRIVNALGVEKDVIEMRLFDDVLESYQDSEDVMTMTAGGLAYIEKNGPVPDTVVFDAVVWPTLEGGDVFSVIANRQPTLKLTATVGTPEAATLVSKEITQNGTYTASDDSADGYSDVTVNVQGEPPVLGAKSISANGLYEAVDDSWDGYAYVQVTVPNSYTSTDEGKVVSSGALVSQTSTTKTANGTYDTTLNDEVTVNVPNSYASTDEGKVVSSGALVSQTSTTKNANGTYDTTLNDEVTVNVPNSYTASDEGKVVSSGALVAQTSTTKIANGTYDTTLNDEVTVNVPNTYEATDEGKVVSSGALVTQTSTTKTANGTYDTTSNNEVIVAVELNVGAKTVTENGTYSASSDSLDGYSQVVVSVTPESDPYDEYVMGTMVQVPSEATSATAIRRHAFYDAHALESANFPNCTVIDVEAFYSCAGLTSISFPLCTTIGSSAFAWCTALEKAVFPSCTTIGSSAFYNCVGLTEASFPELSSMPSSAFAWCVALEQATFPKLERVLNYAFSYCLNLAEISLPNVSSISAYAFNYCLALSKVYAPSLKTLGSNVFSYATTLEKADLPECTTLGTYAFANCYTLSEASFPKCLAVPYGTFMGCTNLTSVYFPECKQIDGYAFANCRRIETASFPKCSKLAGTALSGCTNLVSLYLMGSSYVSLSDANAIFYSSPLSSGGSGVIYVPESMYSTYVSMSYWSLLAGRLSGI